MLDFVLIDGQESGRFDEDRDALVAELTELVKHAEDGRLKLFCFAGIEGDDLTFGIVRSRRQPVGQIAGVTQLLAARMLQAARES